MIEKLPMQDVFKFRLFDVVQGRSGQRINTDSYAFADVISCVPDPARIIDIGSGTGVLSLMMAQKFPQANITAVEIDAELAGLAAKNFHDSRFHQRLKIIGQDIREISDADNGIFLSKKMDLVICNPPFFINSEKSSHDQRAKARHGLTLTPEQLAIAAEKLMTNSGTFWIFCAVNDAWRFKQALIGKFFCEEIVQIAHSPSARAHREALKLRLVTSGIDRAREAKSSRIDYRNNDGTPSNWMIEHRKRWFPF